MPRKLRELIKDLNDAGFINRGGKGSHNKYIHPKISKFVVLSGKLSSDAKHYQEKAVRTAIQEVENET